MVITLRDASVLAEVSLFLEQTVRRPRTTIQRIMILIVLFALLFWAWAEWKKRQVVNVIDPFDAVEMLPASSRP
jgi:hypothetical protein